MLILKKRLFKWQLTIFYNKVFKIILTTLNSYFIHKATQVTVNYAALKLATLLTMSNQVDILINDRVLWTYEKRWISTSAYLNVRTCSNDNVLILSTVKYWAAHSLSKDARNTFGSDESVSLAKAWNTDVTSGRFSNTLMVSGRLVNTGSLLISTII